MSRSLSSHPRCSLAAPPVSDITITPSWHQHRSLACACVRRLARMQMCLRASVCVFLNGSFPEHGFKAHNCQNGDPRRPAVPTILIHFNKKHKMRNPMRHARRHAKSSSLCPSFHFLLDYAVISHLYLVKCGYPPSSVFILSPLLEISPLWFLVPNICQQVLLA